MTDARPDTAGLSGATPAEAVSSGQVDLDQHPGTVGGYPGHPVEHPLRAPQRLARRTVGDVRTRGGVIAWGVGIWSFCTSRGGAVRGVWQMLCCRAMVGVGEAVCGSPSQALIAEYYKERRRAWALGIYSVGTAL